MEYYDLPENSKASEELICSPMWTGNGSSKLTSFAGFYMTPVIK